MMAGASFRQVKRRRTVVKPVAGTVPVSVKSASNALALKVTKLAKLVKGIAPERKFLDVALSLPNVLDTAGGIQHLTAIAQGDTNSSRQGNKIRIKHIYVATHINLTALASVGPDTYMRFAIVQDMQQVADTVPTVASIVRSTSDPISTLINTDSQGRYRIIHWFRLVTALRVTSSVGITGIEPSVQVFSKWVDIPVTFNGTTSADIQKNGLYLIAMSSDSTDTLDMDGICRLTYIDD